MTGYVKLDITEVNFFCRAINNIDGQIIAIEGERIVYIKSLISLLTLDLSKEICIQADCILDKDKKLFKEIITRYGGRIDD